MKIKLSTIPEYAQFRKSLYDGNYGDAEKSLTACIKIAHAENDNDGIAFLTEALAELTFLKGQIEKAIEYYSEAERISENSPLTKYNFAKFLAIKAHQYVDAIDKCEEVVKLVQTSPWEESDDDFGSNYYLAQCYALEGFCFCVLERHDRGHELLERLMAIPDEMAIDIGVQLCELLLKNEQFATAAETYLKRLSEGVVNKHGEGEYQDFIRQIEGLLRGRGQN